MTDFDRGTFVDGKAITIEPCANGSFIVRRGADREDRPARLFNMEAMAFSSSQDMLHWLTSEYQANMPSNGEVTFHYTVRDTGPLNVKVDTKEDGK
jgi:hypothetical protein